MLNHLGSRMFHHLSIWRWDMYMSLQLVYTLRHEQFRL